MRSTQLLSTHFRWWAKAITKKLLLPIGLITAFNTQTYSQNVQYVSTIVSQNDVVNGNNCIDGNLATGAILEADPGVLLGLGVVSPKIRMQWPQSHPANTPIYVKLDTDTGVLETLLGGTLGQVLGSVLSFVIAGEQSILFKVYNNANTVVFSVNSKLMTDYSERFRFVRDAQGHVYARLVPNGAFNKIEVQHLMVALLGLGNNQTLVVYDPFVVTTPNPCGTPVYTAFDSRSVSLDVAGLGGPPVTNLQRAIDSDVNTFSTMTLGLLGIGSHVEQKFYFQGLSTTGQAYTITLKAPNSFIHISLSNSIKFYTYGNGVRKDTFTLAQVMTPAQQIVYEAGLPTTLTIIPTQPTDGFGIELSGILDVSVQQALEIHEVTRTAVIPVLDANSSDQTVCYGATANLVGITVDPSHEIRWYSSMTSTTPMGITNSSSPIFVTPQIYTATTFYMAAAIPGCGPESGRVPVIVNVIPSPGATDLSITGPTVTCSIDTIVLTATSSVGSNFQWYDGANSTTPLTTGVHNGVTYIINNDVLMATAINVTNSPITFYGSVQSSANGCWTPAGGYASYSVNLIDTLAPTTSQPEVIYCASELKTVGDLIMNGSNIQWYDAATGGNQLSLSELLTNGYYYASQTGSQCESFERTAVHAIINDESAPTSSATTQFWCASDNATIADLVVNQSNVFWYDGNGNLLPSSTVLQDSTMYYAKFQGAVCLSSDSLGILAVISDLPTPTTDDATQYFCTYDNPTVEDIVTNNVNVHWYDAADNELPNNTPLVHNTIYYGAMQTATCASSTKLEVTVLFETPLVPTTDQTTQTFCNDINGAPATLADVQVNEPSLTWYDAEVGGNVLPNSTVLVHGQTYYVAHQGTYCESDTKLAITVNVYDLDLSNIQLTGATENICVYDTITYSVPVGFVNYTWSVGEGTIIAGGGINDNTITVLWNGNDDAYLVVNYQNANGCTIGDTVAIEANLVGCSDLSITKTVDILNPLIGQQVVFTITVSNDGASNFANIVVEEQLQDGFEFISSNATIGDYNELTGLWTIPTLGGYEVAILEITAKVNPTGPYHNVAGIISHPTPNSDNDVDTVIVDPKCLIVYNQFSPNGDGDNDYFQIDCIEQYPDSKISIFNRYGNLVFEVDGYQNDWNGVANVGGVVAKGELLPTGTYFYIIKVDSEKFEDSGWIYIVR